MKKIYYWCPFLSHVATINNVLNSAISLAKYEKNLQISLLDTIGEWQFAREKLGYNGVGIEKLTNLKFNNYKTGFLKSRFYLIFLFIFNFFPLITKLRIKKPDFIIIHLLTSLPLIILYFFKFETKFILRISGLPKLNIFRKFLWKLISKKIYLVTCPSNETLNDLKSLNIFDKQKVVLLEDPIINVGHIQKLKKNFTQNFDKKEYFLNIGRLTKQKNQILLIELFKVIKDNNKNFILYILGDGEEKKKLKKKIKEYNLENNIFLLGFKENVFEYIQHSRALISSSLWEDPGATMIEASYCNLPVISSDCKNGPKEFLMNNQAGYLFENNNLNSLHYSFNKFLIEERSIINSKILLAKKNSRNYSMYNHFKKLNYFLNN